MKGLNLFHSASSRQRPHTCLHQLYSAALLLLAGLRTNRDRVLLVPTPNRRLCIVQPAGAGSSRV